MQKYITVFKLGILDALEYRFNLLASTFKYAITILFAIFIWRFVGQNSDNVLLQTEALLIYYTTAAILYSLSNFHTDYYEEDIRLGMLSKFLLKPISVYWYYFAHTASKVFLSTVLKIVVLIPFLWVLGALPKMSPSGLALFLAFIPLVYIFSFTFLFSFSSLAFWFTEINAVRWGWFAIQRLISGIWVPLTLFPAWFKAISWYLPFQHTVFTPAEVLRSNFDIATGLQGLGVLGLWIVLAAGVFRLIWNQGIRKYESTGQ